MSVALKNLEDTGYDRTVEMRRRGRISIDSSIMGGVPCIKGTRLAVGRVVLDLAAGSTFEDIIDSYSHLEITREDIDAALEYAGWHCLNLEITR